MTPPPFDHVPLRDQGKLKPLGEAKYAYFAVYENYDDVVAEFGRWIMTGLGESTDMTIDLHGPLSEHLKQRRVAEPSYTLAPDGVHPNPAGHRVIASTILRAWGVDHEIEVPAALGKLANQRGQVLHDAWLTRIGHKRPGVRDGLPMKQAQAEAQRLLEEMQPLMDKLKQGSGGGIRGRDQGSGIRGQGSGNELAPDQRILKSRTGRPQISPGCSAVQPWVVHAIGDEPSGGSGPRTESGGPASDQGSLPPDPCLLLPAS